MESLNLVDDFEKERREKDSIWETYQRLFDEGKITHINWEAIAHMSKPCTHKKTIAVPNGILTVETLMICAPRRGLICIEPTGREHLVECEEFEIQEAICQGCNQIRALKIRKVKEDE
jgi:hypothetical protein